MVQQLLIDRVRKSNGGRVVDGKCGLISIHFPFFHSPCIRHQKKYEFSTVCFGGSQHFDPNSRNNDVGSSTMQQSSFPHWLTNMAKTPTRSQLLGSLWYSGRIYIVPPKSWTKRDTILFLIDELGL